MSDFSMSDMSGTRDTSIQSASEAQPIRDLLTGLALFACGIAVTAAFAFLLSDTLSR